MVDTPELPLAWGAKVSPRFRAVVRAMANDLGMPPAGASWLMACMAFESARTFSPKIKNAAGSGAVGLIQFMPATARGLKTTTAKLAAMSAEDQVEYVWEYFTPYKGKLQNIGDVYMAILWPAAIGKPDHHVLWEKGSRPVVYRQNSGLDLNGDATITKQEAYAKVKAILELGYDSKFVSL